MIHKRESTLWSLVKRNRMIRMAYSRLTIAPSATLLCALIVSFGAQGQTVPAADGKSAAVREGTLRVPSFGLGAPLPGPPVDDLYGRDAVLFADAVKRAASAWSKVETIAISGLDCTPERLRSELQKLENATVASDFVIVHASRHGTAEDKLWTMRKVESRRVDGQAPGVAWDFRR
jgi:hypothetical protein